MAVYGAKLTFSYHPLDKYRDGLSFPAPVHTYLQEFNLRHMNGISDFVQGTAFPCPWPQSYYCGLFSYVCWRQSVVPSNP